MYNRFNSKIGKINQASSAVNRFFDFHRRYNGNPPSTLKECQLGEELAWNAYHETKNGPTNSGPFVGYANRYKKFSEEFGKKPQEPQQQEFFPETSTPRATKPIYKDPMTHPHYLGDGWTP